MKTQNTNTTQILNTFKCETGVGMEIACGKISAYVYFNKWGIDICQNNASHRAWKGMGKFYRSLDEALNHYRSDAMRKILFVAAAHREALAA
jgi:hypothetical protein